ncbi:MAG: hypothetical protein U1F34_01200 [Gammaproteobacteria bacterium]
MTSITTPILSLSSFSAPTALAAAPSPSQTLDLGDGLLDDHATRLRGLVHGGG